MHSRIVADRSIRYAGDDPTFVEQSARIVLHRDRGDDQGFGSQHLDEGVELRNNSGCEGGALNGYRYLRDIERDYAAFNEERTAFFREQALNPLPASTGIQAILCRPELLIEIEAIAMFRTAPRA